MDPLYPYTNTGTFNNKTGSTMTTYTKFATGAPWTTGIVTVVAARSSYATSLQRKGCDTTTPGGVRNIQLVTPSLTDWKRGHGKPFNHTGHIGVIKIRLVPEPTRLAMFATGGFALLLLHRASLRSSSRRGFTA